MGVGCPEYILLGSPPRGRGKAKFKVNAGPHLGITPAQAGKSCRWCHHRRTAWDHPRVGGEKFCRVRLCPMCQGSPPRGQGKVLAAGLHNLIDRITPAWAGKRGPGPVKLGRSRDHPRVGGEKSDPGVVTNSIKGSPPRGRGKAAAFAFASCCFGITPAWAGKSCPEWRGMLRSGVHPRTGGEKRERRRIANDALGSPPRGRGKGGGCSVVCAQIGITPAQAGKRSSNRPFLK